jgi:dihydroorotate dehydrogenase (NAD+) catalytic subunit
VRAACRLPVIAKLSPNVPEFLEVAKASHANGADCVTVSNTFIGMAVDIKNRKPKITNVTAGYSGPGIKPLALRNVWIVIKNLKIPVIASGGIMNVSDALEFLITGASAVEVGTAHFINPRAGVEIIEGIKAYMLEYNTACVKDIIGSLKCSNR